jgi:hypothetical protein
MDSYGGVIQQNRVKCSASTSAGRPAPRAPRQRRWVAISEEAGRQLDRHSADSAGIEPRGKIQGNIIAGKTARLSTPYLQQKTKGMGMGKQMPALFSLADLKQADHDDEQQKADLRLALQTKCAANSARDEAAWKLLPLITLLSQQHGVCARDLERKLVSAFVEVCSVMREQALVVKLDELDEGRMVEHYRGGRTMNTAKMAYELAVKALRQGIKSADLPGFRTEVAKTLRNPVGRIMWSMIHAIVQGLMTKQGRVYWIRDLPSMQGTDVEPIRRRRPCFERDHLWLQWHDAGLKPAAIRDRWNAEYQQHGGPPLNKCKESARQVIKEGLKKARKERQEQKVSPLSP